MLSTGIPELQSETDINYLRESLCLSKTDEQASQFFMDLIRESLNSKATALNFFVHNVVQQRKNKTPRLKSEEKNIKETETELPWWYHKMWVRIHGFHADQLSIYWTCSIITNRIAEKKENINHQFNSLICPHSVFDSLTLLSHLLLFVSYSRILLVVELFAIDFGECCAAAFSCICLYSTSSVQEGIKSVSMQRSKNYLRIYRSIEPEIMEF